MIWGANTKKVPLFRKMGESSSCPVGKWGGNLPLGKKLRGAPLPKAVALPSGNSFCMRFAHIYTACGRVGPFGKP